VYSSPNVIYIYIYIHTHTHILTYIYKFIGKDPDFPGLFIQCFQNKKPLSLNMHNTHIVLYTLHRRPL